LTVTLFPDGSFTAVRSGCPAAPATCAAAVLAFPHIAVNSEKVPSPSAANVSLSFNPSSGLVVRVQDAKTPTTQITDYKWIIEQDRTFQIDPTTQVNTGTGLVPSLATNFHTSYMPVVAVGCTGVQSCERSQTIFDPTTGLHVPAVCEGSGICSPAPAGSTLPTSTIDQAYLPTLDANGHAISYYLSVLPGDAANAFNTGNSSDPTVAGSCIAATTATGVAINSNCGHTMGGAPITPTCTTVGTATTCTLPASITVNVEPNPLPTASVSVYVWEDDNELNGEVDSELQLPGDEGKQAEPGLADFQLELWDTGGSSGDLIGQMTYDMFNEPLTNAYNGTIDPLTGMDACPISNQTSQDPLTLGGTIPVGVILVCPEFESDGVTK